MSAAGSGAAPAVSAPAAPPKPIIPSTPRAEAQPANAPATAPPSGLEILPCLVSQTLASNCQTCHGTTPIGGAPMALVSFADLHKPAPTQPGMKVYQLAQLRIHDARRPMPPTTTMKAADVETLDEWFSSGALAGTSANANCAVAPPKPELVEGNVDGAYGPLKAGPGETCYEFKTHNSTTNVDDKAYEVGGSGEHYEQFYFTVPWAKDSVATSYATVVDNPKVLHHWLLFSTSEREVNGFHKTVPLPTLVGASPVLLTGWALGGPNLVAPKDVGFELPNPGAQLNVQWHFYNSTGSPQRDASSVQICVVPKSMRQHVAAVTWLGTEDLNGNKWFGGAGMPPHQVSTFSSVCNPPRTGVAQSEPLHIIGFEPHMHRIGTRMQTEVIHKDGKVESIFDQPFSFGNERHYFQNYDLLPGERLKTSCTFNNTNDYGVAFGESTDTEMCYNFVLSWPAHAMANGAASLLGVTDTCW